MSTTILLVAQSYGATFTVTRETAEPCLAFPLCENLEKFGHVAGRAFCPVLIPRTHYQIRAFFSDGTSSVTWTDSPKQGRKFYVPNFDTYFRALVSEKTGKPYGPDFLPENKDYKALASVWMTRRAGT